jgi:hypothetical protein
LVVPLELLEKLVGCLDVCLLGRGLVALVVVIALLGLVALLVLIALRGLRLVLATLRMMLMRRRGGGNASSSSDSGLFNVDRGEYASTRKLITQIWRRGI